MSQAKIIFQVSGHPGKPAGFTSYGATATDQYSSPPPSGAGGNGGNGNGNDNGGNTGYGGSGGNNGPDFYCNRDYLTKTGFTEDVTNTVTQSGLLSAWATNALNERNSQQYGSSHTNEYQSNDHAFRGNSQPSADDEKLLRFHVEEGRPGGQYHASIRELESKAQLRFNGHAYTSYTDDGNTIAYSKGDAIKVAVQKFLDLDGPLRNYSSEARFTPTVVEVEISRTRSGKQQVRVKDFDIGVEYQNTRPVGELFDWLKFKP